MCTLVGPSATLGAGRALQQAPDATTLPPTRRTVRNRFTHSHASHHALAHVASAFLDSHGTCKREDMPFQISSINHFKQAKVCDFRERCKAEARMPIDDQIIALKLLLHTAAVRDTAGIRKNGAPAEVVSFMCGVWNSLLQQFRVYLNENDSNVDQLLARVHDAVEIISTLGLWYGGQLSIPFRRYIAQTISEEGIPQNLIVMGPVAFAPSMYVLNIRVSTQQRILEELCRLGKEANHRVFFLPPQIAPAFSVQVCQ
ncbi:hypothetical protein ERJ75_000242200 [Trypanosoma vivax]|uniref:Uncharacterized protein n=1 Tax=Trypanosoma vivax (strain Y486) TaxID=1055687 RepID=G0TXZ9_TRYVY|nr:hypothetical protein TRVL_04549 [Trypanosoma vivax]KAH8618616.1 hypothetical protein ERJ75_000242200 [Trypanosoma vivax]CCC48844.1 conserved hypothetical protein [Trypanosoma vivax Y486]